MNKKIRIVELKISYLCNQKCYFCLFEDRKNFSLMSKEEVFKNLSYIKEKVKPDAMILSGGESTIHPNFNEIVKFIAEKIKPGAMSIHTNALYFKKKENLAKIPKYTSFFISFNAATQKTYEEMSGVKRSVNDIIKGIENIKKKGHIVNISCIITKDNLKEFEKICQILSILKVDSVQICIPFLNKKTIHIKNKLAFTSEELKENLEKGIKILKNNNILYYFQHKPLCFMRESFTFSPKDIKKEYYFFDKWHQYKNYTKNPKQLNAIINNFFERYYYGKKCRKCKLREKCKGVPLEHKGIYHIK